MLLFSVVALLASVLSPLAAAAPLPLNRAAPAVQADLTFFPETGYRLGNPQFAEYFTLRGGLRTFGYPVSRPFLFLGTQVQFFQRQIMQLRPDGGVGTLNILDADLMPYTRINGSVFPAASPTVLSGAPTPGSPSYAEQVLAFVQARAPDVWQGQPVNFYQTYQNTVRYEEAFPNREVGPGIMPIVNLELWGVPTSEPAHDPTNAGFVYLRFQRGIMHYDAASGATQGLLLADYLKSILTGLNLPPDLEAQARASRFYRQYNPSRSGSIDRPYLLPATDMTDAFVPDIPGATPQVSSEPRLPAPPYDPDKLGYGMAVHLWWQDQHREVNLVKDAGFGWIVQQIRWADVEPVKGSPDFSELDRMVDAAMLAGVNVLFSVVSSPSWARANGRTNGPPDDLADFAAFAGKLAERYRGQVRAYEIWNEQNLSREWGGGPIDAGRYVELLKAAYPAIKAADPQAIVLTGGLSPTGVDDPARAIDDVRYLERMYQYQNGIVREVSDAIGAHAGGFNNPPEADPVPANAPFKNHPSFYFRRIEQLREVMVRHGDGATKMWLTEFGWSIRNPAPGYEYGADNTEQEQADYLVRAFQLARTRYPWLGVMFVWNLNFNTLRDLPWDDEKRAFSLLYEDFRPRPAYTALKAMPK